MPLLQLAIRLSHIDKRVDSSNRDFHFTLVDKPGEMLQYHSACPRNISFSLDTILLHRFKVDNRIDPLWSHAELERKFDVICAECIDEGVDVIIGSRSNTLLNALTVGDRDDMMVL